MSRRYHVAAFSRNSGISRYAHVFNRLVLEARGYQRIDTSADDCVQRCSALLEADDVLHFEVGVNEHSTIEVLRALITRGFHNLDVTMHDPPFLRWPKVRFRNALLNRSSKAVQLLLSALRWEEHELRRVRRLFVLTEAGRRVLLQRHNPRRVHYLPFVVPVNDIHDPTPAPPNLLFFGFVAPNKGLDYALALHAEVRRQLPATRLIVIGDSIDEVGARYLRTLQATYHQGVEYRGFVAEPDLPTQFMEASVVVLPFRPYRSVIPASASLLEGMARGKAVAATGVNAVQQFIRHGETGYLLNGSIRRDADLLVRVLSEPGQSMDVAQRSVDYLRRHHNPAVVGQTFDACAK